VRSNVVDVLLDLEGPEPLYRQIAAILTKGIGDGTYPPNRRLPSESELCETYGVSRDTARAAVAVLVSEGLAQTVRGKGTFVLKRADTE
jgi:GntR family transcriptional regulator